MLVQIGLERKRFSTAAAAEVLGRGVGLQVGAQVAPVSKGLTTEGACVGLITGVGPASTGGKKLHT